MFVNSDGAIIVYGCHNSTRILRMLAHSGRHIRDITLFTSPDSCHSHALVANPADAEILLHACPFSIDVRRCSFNSEERLRVLTDKKDDRSEAQSDKAYATCLGPDDSMLLWNASGSVLQLKTNHADNLIPLKVIHNEMDPTVVGFKSMSYMKHSDTIIMLRSGVFIQALKLSDDTILWKLENNEKLVDIVSARAVTCDEDSYVYVWGCSNTLYILDSAQGDVVQRAEQTDQNPVTTICWTEFEPHLILLHEDGQITRYNVERKIRAA